jgi:hypothetical protein
MSMSMPCKKSDGKVCLNFPSWFGGKQCMWYPKLGSCRQAAQFDMPSEYQMWMRLHAGYPNLFYTITKMLDPKYKKPVAGSDGICGS